MATKSLTFDIFGRDRSASRAMRGVSGAATRMGDTMRRVGQIAAVGLAVATAAAIRFGIDSVKAFADAQEAQNKLAFAFEKFPALADINIGALRKYNEQLARKTRFDDDATASGQAVLAQFGLTGTQLKKLTPLLQDYAARTGKDLPTAAQDLGKALLGQGRALKAVGLELGDTGTLVGNFDQLVQGLSSTVGGFAERDAQTAAGRLEILQNRFGEVQEKVGEALLPALEDLMGFFESDVMPGFEGFAGWIAGTGVPAVKDMVGWVIQWKDILGPAAIALGVLTAAQWLLNIAMDANPIGVIILALGALVTLATLVATNWNTVTRVVMQSTGGIAVAIMNLAVGMAQGVQNMVNGLLAAIAPVLSVINGILDFLGMGRISLPISINFTSGLEGLRDRFNAGVMAGQLGGINAAIAQMNGGGPSGSGQGGGGTARALASGGIVRATPGGVYANIGEGRHDEAVIPLTRSGLAAYGLGGGGNTYITVQGYVGSEAQLAKEFARIQRNGRKVGATSRTAVA